MKSDLTRFPPRFGATTVSCMPRTWRRRDRILTTIGLDPGKRFRLGQVLGRLIVRFMTKDHSAFRAGVAHEMHKVNMGHRNA